MSIGFFMPSTMNTSPRPSTRSMRGARSRPAGSM
jgi:hypothetical protein